MILSNLHVLAYRNGISHIIGEVFIDDVSELPEKDGINGYELTQGSIAYVIKSGEIYVMGGDGKWYDSNGKEVNNELA